MLRLFIASAAADRVAAASDFLRSFPPATEVLVVSGNRGAADDLVRGLAKEQIATFGFHRFSLTQLAHRAAAGELASRNLTPATRLAAQASAAHITYRFAAKRALPYFAPVADYPGFAPSLADTLHELRAARVATLSQPPDLSVLLAAYDDELEENQLSDAAVLFELATDVLRKLPLSVPLLLLDLRPESKVQRTFIQTLTSASKTVFITLHTADEASRQFYESLPSAEILLPPKRSAATSLERLRANLFSPESLSAAEFDESVVFFSAPGEGREAVEIARAILGHARRGTRFDEMAIFLRNPAKYQAHLEAAFERAGIPAYHARGSRRPDPAGRALLALLACAAEGLSARRFGEYLSLGQVPDKKRTETWRPPEELGELIDVSALEMDEERRQATATQFEPYRWEALIVEAAVIGGKERWRRRLKGLDLELRRKLEELRSEEPDSSRIDAIERQLTRLGQLSEFALPIIEMLDALKECRSWRDWIDALRNLAAATLRSPDRVLEVLTELEPMAEVSPIGIDEVRGTLTERLNSLEVRPPKRRFGRVFLAPIEQAAGRSFKVVFVPGLVERGFPQKLHEDPLLLDAARRVISTDLETSDERAADERLRLQLAVGAAEAFLYVSYPRLDAAQGRSRVASFYALDVIRAVIGRIPDQDKLERTATRMIGARLAWPAPASADRAIDDLEHDLAVLHPRLAISKKGEQAGRARYLLELNSYLAQALRARYARWEKKPWNRFDGIVKASDGIRDALQAKSMKISPYSASSLQRFAACPYQFYLAAILRLEPREEPDSPVRLDALTRGKLIHEIHAATLRQLKVEGLLPLTAQRVAAAEQVLHGIVDRAAVKWEEEIAPAIPRVWTDEITMIRTDLRLWLREIAAETDQWIAETCELAFGLAPSPDFDERSVRQPVRLDGDFLLHGAVDLVERRVVFGDLRVTDYKTGSNHTKDDMVIGGGETLQPMLYALAVEKIFGEDVSVSRLFFSTSRGGFTKRDVDITPKSREIIGDFLAQIDEAVTLGFLPPAPRGQRRWIACDWCDFITICGPYEPIRMQRKDPEKLAALERLRDQK
jgi:ATP-dependent helicase/nuclease subunit B